MPQPLVSIIVPTYNRADLITDTLNSIQEQTYTHWECLMVDDGSTDATQGLMQDYCKQDSRFQYHKRPVDRPKGANACRNYGFELSKGDYINWFDSDDIMHPEKLELQVKALELNKTTPYCICQTRWINKEGGTFMGLRSKQISSGHRFEDYICFKIFWSILAPLWQRDFLEAHHLLFDEHLHQSQEYDFHIKALAINSDYIALEQPLVDMVMHEGNLSHHILMDDAKVQSNIAVKLRTLQTYSDRLSRASKLKLLEMLTLMYKDLLCLKRFTMAKVLQNTLTIALNHVPLNGLKRFRFYLRIHLIYLSYRIFGRGYGLLKPLT